MNKQLNTGPGRGRPARLIGRRGFTLTEACITMSIVAVGLVATLQLLAAGTSSNIDATASTMAVNLGRNIREMTLRMTYDEVLALNGHTFTPPIDSRGETVGDFADWAQQIIVQSVSWDQLTTETIEASPEAVRVTVRVTHNGEFGGEVQWYRFKPGA